MHGLKTRTIKGARVGFTCYTWRYDESAAIRIAIRAMAAGLRKGFDTPVMPLPDCWFQFVWLLGTDPLEPAFQDDRIVSVVYSKKFKTLAFRTEMSVLDPEVTAEGLVGRFFLLAKQGVDRVVFIAAGEELGLSADTYGSVLAAAEGFSLKAIEAIALKGSC